MTDPVVGSIVARREISASSCDPRYPAAKRMEERQCRSWASISHSTSMALKIMTEILWIRLKEVLIVL